MKCPACGEENVSNARFCAFCGEKFVVAAPRTEPQPDTTDARDEKTAVSAPERRHMPVISGEETAPRRPAQTGAGGMFLFEDEKQDEERRMRTLEQEKAMARRRIEQQRRDDPFYGEDDEDDDDEYDDEIDDEERSRVRTVVMAAISIVTVVALIALGSIFVFRTSAGRRLRATYGIAASSEDYYELGTWHKGNGSYAEATDAYYRAFLLNQDDFDFALKIGREFENCNALERAEQMYLYLIDKYPGRNEPYDYLMALLIREGKTEQYNGLIQLRAQNQPGYAAPAYEPAPAPAMPQVSPQSGGFTGSVRITMAAEEGATIYFSLDGSEPTEASRQYTEPFKLYTGNYTLRAVAIRNGVRSEVLKVTYTIS